MDRLADEDTYREEFTRFSVNMACLLNWMIREAEKARTTAISPAPLATSTFMGQGYRLELVCRSRGIRPLVALMAEPLQRGVHLGRLARGGRLHLFAHGLKAFFGQLHEAGIYELFAEDLEQALDMHLLGATRPACASCSSCASSGSDCREKPQTTVH
ncbi:hypothetical protein [Desulfolutivibrio sp.]|uniref:hypothetical protein n=1 Tax=Desulfolutivibrio sp. TaxID=2773296 RepID=UPI002F96642A